MKTRIVAEEDLSMVEHWFLCRGVSLPPRELLPSVGFIAEDDGIPKACVFLYVSVEGNVGWVAFLSASPNNEPEESVDGIQAVLSVASSTAKSLGVKMLFASAEKSSLGTVLVSEGFMPSHVSVQYFKILEG